MIAPAGWRSWGSSVDSVSAAPSVEGASKEASKSKNELGLGAVFAILEMFLPNSSSGFRSHYFKWKTFFLPVAQELRHLERRHIWTFQYPEQDDFPLPFGTLRSFIQFSFLWIDPGKMWFPQFSIRHLLKRTPKKYFLPKKTISFLWLAMFGSELFLFVCHL